MKLSILVVAKYVVFTVRTQAELKPLEVLGYPVKKSIVIISSVHYGILVL
jgi:hypothetical protein